MHCRTQHAIRPACRHRTRRSHGSCPDRTTTVRAALYAFDPGAANLTGWPELIRPARNRRSARAWHRAGRLAPFHTEKGVEGDGDAYAIIGFGLEGGDFVQHPGGEQQQLSRL